MNILTRYLAREFSQNFLLSLAGFSTLYLIVEFFERINAFLYNKATLPMMAAYFLNKIPSILFQVAPASVLLAAIVTLGLMSRHNEILAMKAGGISLWRTSFPILGVVVIIYFILLGINELILPATNQNVRTIYDLIIYRKMPVAAFKQSQIWIHSHQAIYNIQLYRPERDILEGITLYRFDPNFQLRERVDARSARWKEGHWIFSEASVTQFARDGFPVRKKYSEIILSLPETPGDFRLAEKDPHEMNYRELRNYVGKIERDGYDASKYRCAMHARISFPFISLIMAFLGIPIALRKERGGGIARAVGFSIPISFLCWWIFSFSLELGKAQALPSFLAAWLSNFIFALVGVYLFLSIRH
ncbi:MAG: LPS export ABC transporter permease LptG [Deltaproteobacteria bacterium]|nr:LPS export ABC transporter permease LptG [Deltaproteobacteria bacterium]